MRPISPREVKLEIEKGSLLSDIDSIGPFSDLSGDFGERKIILLRYPIKKPIKI